MITQEQLAEMLVMMDKDGDGTVDKSEFKTALLCLHPKTTDGEYDTIWNNIDVNKDGNLSAEELAHYFGFDYNALGKDIEDHKARASMSDDQILEALQMHAALRDLENEARAKASPEPPKRPNQRRASREGLPMHPGADGIETIRMPTKITGTELDPKIEFMQACEVGDDADIKTAIEKGVSVRIEDEKGEMPLHKICRTGSREACKLVLDQSRKVSSDARQYDINAQEKKNGYSPIFMAINFQGSELVKSFLDWGADPTVVSNHGWNILHAIVSKCDKEMLKTVISHEKVMEKRSKLLAAGDVDGRTPMHIAAFKADEDIVTILLNNGAKATSEDSAGNTPAKLAEKTGRRKSRDILDAATTGVAAKA